MDIVHSGASTNAPDLKNSSALTCRFSELADTFVVEVDPFRYVEHGLVCEHVIVDTSSAAQLDKLWRSQTDYVSHGAALYALVTSWCATAFYSGSRRSMLAHTKSSTKAPKRTTAAPCDTFQQRISSVPTVSLMLFFAKSAIKPPQMVVGCEDFRVGSKERNKANLLAGQKNF